MEGKDLKNVRFGKMSVPMLVLCVTSILLVQCTNKVELKSDPFFEKWRLEAVKSKGTSPKERDRSVEILAKTEQMDESIEEQRSLPKTRVTLKMRNAKIDILLRALARAARQNILIKSDVKGEITVDFKNVPWDEAFISIMRSKMLTYVWDGSIIRIATVKDLENDLKLDSIREKRREQEILRSRLSPLHTIVVPIDYITVGGSSDKNAGLGLEELTANIETFLTKDEQGKPYGSVRISKHTNSLIIQATKKDLTKIIPVIQELDKPMPQIRIEATIVEATSDVARDLGMQWGGLYHGTGNGNNYWVTPGANAEGVTGETLSTGVDPTSGAAVSFPAQSLSDASGFTLGYVAEKAGSYVLNVQLSALQDEGKLNILSSPSITTLDNQTAYTENGEKIPYATVDDEGDRTIKFEDAVLRLEITPHVIDGQNMKMDIQVKKDEVDFSRTVDENPVIIKKETSTTLIVRDGSTIVISGLSKKKNIDVDSGVPWVMNIPYLGNLFKRDLKQKSMEEVLIFITPHILKMESPLGEIEDYIEEQRNESETAGSLSNNLNRLHN